MGATPASKSACSRSARSASQNAWSWSARSQQLVDPRASERQLLRREHPAGRRGAHQRQQVGQVLLVVSGARRSCPLDGAAADFLPAVCIAQLAEAAGDAAGDRAARDVERLADGRVALVLAEEAVEDVAALRLQASPARRAPRAPRRAARAARRRPGAPGRRPPGSMRPRRRISSTHSRRASWPIQPRTASSSRSRSRFANVRANVSWKTSSASASDSR